MYDPPNIPGWREPRRARLPRERLQRIAKVVIAAVSIPILVSMGAQFIAAPVLFPALWWASNSSRKWGAAFFTFLAAWLMTYVGWLVAYLATREERPWIVLGPALGFSATIAFFMRTRRRLEGDK